MKEVFSSPLFGIFLSILAFWAGEKLQKKTGLTACSPLLTAIVLIIGVLLLFDIPYESYNEGGEIINMFLAPATACLAVSIYTRIRLLKRHWLPILVGCTCGSLASMGSIYLMCTLFRLDEKITHSLLSKSVTTPIAVSITERFSRRGACDSGSCPHHRNTGKYTGPLLCPDLPGKGSSRGGSCHRGLQPCGRNLQGAGDGGDGRGHERTCHRHLRHYHSHLFPVYLIFQAEEHKRTQPALPVCGGAGCVLLFLALASDVTSADAIRYAVDIRNINIRFYVVQ